MLRKGIVLYYEYEKIFVSSLDRRSAFNVPAILQQRLGQELGNPSTAAVPWIDPRRERYHAILYHLQRNGGRKKSNDPI